MPGDHDPTLGRALGALDQVVEAADGLAGTPPADAVPVRLSPRLLARIRELTTVRAGRQPCEPCEGWGWVPHPGCPVWGPMTCHVPCACVRADAEADGPCAHQAEQAWVAEVAGDE